VRLQAQDGRTTFVPVNSRDSQRGLFRRSHAPCQRRPCEANHKGPEFVAPALVCIAKLARPVSLISPRKIGQAHSDRLHRHRGRNNPGPSCIAVGNRDRRRGNMETPEIGTAATRFEIKNWR
jgi:hypothetical protein